MRAAVAAVRQRGPAKIVAAVPVGATSTCLSLSHVVDRLECVIESPEFFAVGAWYEDFSQTTDEEVRTLLDELAEHDCHPRPKTGVDPVTWTP
jgi:predicted phosphoribosyltransferase